MVRSAWWRKLLHTGPSPNEVVKALDPLLPSHLRLVKDDDLPAKILIMEEKQVDLLALILSRAVDCRFFLPFLLWAILVAAWLQVWNTLCQRGADQGR